MKIPDSARQLIESGAHAHLVTLNADGSPQVTVVWAGVDGDEVVTAHLMESQKIKNVRRDARVALTFESPTQSAMGLTEYLVMYGRARLVPGGAPALLQRLARIYLGPDVKFPPMDQPPPGNVMHITVERIAGVGPWTGRAV
ncbi:MAG: PPOX class F420-dependent oxidoreductase [Anaerolineae bacterium]|nr:PPOX class F420-dependent oxidoreductase [Anaerolineae bacterium]